MNNLRTLFLVAVSGIAMLTLSSCVTTGGGKSCCAKKSCCCNGGNEACTVHGPNCKKCDHCVK